MTNDYKKNRIAIMLLILIVALGFFFRVIYVLNHFSQDDEAIHLLNRLDEYQKMEYFINIGHVNERPLNDSSKYIKLFPNSPYSYEFIITPEMINGNPVLYSLKTAYQMTYAPFYSFMAGFIINDNAPYEKRLMQLRFPNLIFSVLSLILFALLMYRLDAGLISGLTPASLLSVAIMPNVYASQGIPYGFLIFLIILQLLFIQHIESRGNINLREAVLAGLLSVVTGYSHWMMFLPNVMFYLSLLAILIFNKKINKEKIIQLVISFTSYMVIMMPGIFLFVLKRAGEAANRKDFYPIEINTDLPFNLTNRLFLIIKSNLSILPEEYLLNTILIYVLIGIILVGVMGMFFRGCAKTKFTLFYSIGVISLYCVASFMKLVPLTPTRHTIFFIPLLLYMISSGIGHMKYVWGNHRQKLEYGVYFITAVIILTALVNFPDSYRDRTKKINNITIQAIEDMAVKYKAQCVVVLNSTEAFLALREKIKIPVRFYSPPNDYGDLEEFDSLLFVSTTKKLASDNKDFLSLVKSLDSNFIISREIADEGISMDVVSEFNLTHVFNHFYVSFVHRL